MTGISGFLFLAALSGRFFAIPSLYEGVLNVYVLYPHSKNSLKFLPFRSTVLFKITGKEEQARIYRDVYDQPSDDALGTDP